MTWKGLDTISCHVPSVPHVIPNLERKTMSSHGGRNILKINIVTVSLVLVTHPFPFISQSDSPYFPTENILQIATPIKLGAQFYSYFNRGK